MPSRLRIDWKKCPDGYELIEFDPSPVKWTTSEANDWKVKPPKGFSPEMTRLLGRWGMTLGPEPGEEQSTFQVIEPLGGESIRYDPMEGVPSLFMTFANTPCTPDGICGFASEYGLIGTGDYPERAEWWYLEIKSMRDALRLLDKPQDADLIAFKEVCENVFKRTEMTLKPAPSVADILQFTVYLEPQSLLAAMWLQLALSIEVASTIVRCQQCSNFIAVAPGTNRPDRKFCSDACRMRAYRKRKGTSR